MSPDWAAKAAPVPYAEIRNPQSLNLYAYVGNNPLSRLDVNGHCWTGFGWACSAGTSLFSTIDKSTTFAFTGQYQTYANWEKANGTSITTSETYNLSNAAVIAAACASARPASRNGMQSMQVDVDLALENTMETESLAMPDTNFTHFTNADGLLGITGVNGASMTPGQSLTVNELTFGTGTNTYLAAQEGDIFVTNLPSNTSPLSLSQIGVFGDKQNFGITFSGEAAAAQGVLVRGQGNGIYTVPEETNLSGCFLVVCR